MLHTAAGAVLDDRSVSMEASAGGGSKTVNLRFIEDGVPGSQSSIMVLPLLKAQTLATPKRSGWVPDCDPGKLRFPKAAIAVA